MKPELKKNLDICDKDVEHITDESDAKIKKHDINVKGIADKL